MNDSFRHTQFLLLNALFAPLLASADVAPSFTVDGQLFSDAAGTSVLSDTGTLTLQILDASQTCVLYEEHQTFDVRSTNGSFQADVGSSLGASKRGGAGSLDVGNPMAMVYGNTNSSGIPGKTLTGGTCTYVPQAGDQRYVRVTVLTDNDHQTRTLAPNMTLQSVPSAVVAERAESLQGLGPGDLLRVNATGNLTQANVESVFANYSTLQSLLSGSSPSYMQSGASTAVLPRPTTAPTNANAAASEGQIWYDAAAHAIKYSDGSSVHALGAAGTGVTNFSVGTGLTSTSGTTVSTGGQTIAINVGTGAGQIPQLDGQGRYPAVDGSQITTMNADNLTSGTLTRPVNTPGSLTAADVRVGSAKIFNGANYVEQLAPAALTGTYSLTWPTALPAAGTQQVLTADAAGNLTWVNLNSGLVNNQAALGNGRIWIGDGTGKAQERTLAGDILLTSAGSTSVVALRGTPIATATPTVSGQTLRFDATSGSYQPGFVAMTDLRSTTTGTNTFGSSCGPAQTLTYDAITDSMSCQAISIAGSNIANDSITATKINSTGVAINRLLITDGVNPNIVTYAQCATNQILAYTPTGWLCTDVSTLAPVTSVAGKTGAVSLNANDVAGLKTAALYDVGTAAGQVPVLDGSARLPAVDGSQLINLNVTTIQSRAVNAAAPAAGQVIAWDAINNQWTPTSVTNGTVTQIASGTGLLGGPISSTGTFSVDVGTTASKILQLNASAQIPAVDGSQLTNVNAVALQSRSLAATLPTPGQVMGWNDSANQWQPVSITSGTVTQIASGTGLIGGPISSTGTLSVDVGAGAGKVVQENANAQIAQGAGTVSLPSYTFTGNTNTGVYSPATNALALVANGTAALYVGADGSVGIGTNAPIAKLDVIGDVRASTTLAAGSAITLNEGSGLYLNGTNAIQNLGTGYVAINPTSASSVGVQLYANGQVAATISGTGAGAGNFGIGSTAPGAKLDVVATNATAIRALSGAGSAYTAISVGRTSPDVSLGVAASANNYATGAVAGDAVLQSTGGKLIFDTNAGAGTPALTIAGGNGNVGIGTTAPATSLDVNGAVSHRGIATTSAPSVAPVGQGRLYFDSTAGQYMISQNGGAYAALATTGGTGAQTFSGDVTMSGAGTSLAVTNDQTVGGSLSVAGTTSLSGPLALNAQNVSGVGANLTGAGALAIAAGGTNQNLTLSGSGSTGAVILTPNVGVGTSSPQSALEVAGTLPVLTVRDNGAASGNSGGAIALVQNKPGANSFNNDHLGALLIQGKGNSNVITAAGIDSTSECGWGSNYSCANLTFSTSSGAYGERMRISGSGNVGIGTNAPATAFDLNGALSQRGLASVPLVAPTGQGRIYFDATLNQFMISQNGGAYASLATSSGTSAQTFSNDVTMNGPGTSLAVTNNQTIGGTLAVTGSTTLSGPLAMSGQTITGVGSNLTGAGAMTIAAGGTNQNLILSGSGTGAVLITPNVGIGTNAPTAPLTVQGSDTVGSTVAMTVQDSGGTPRLQVRDNAVYNTVSVNGGIQATNGFFAISGQGMTWDNSLTSITGDGVTGGTSNFLNFKTNSANRMRIDSAGNVGIGTSAPTSLLTTTDTAAKTLSYTGVVHNVNNTSSTNSVNKVGMDIESTGAWTGTSAVNTGLVVNATGGTTNYAATFSGGNVGIGTNAPSATLAVTPRNSTVTNLASSAIFGSNIPLGTTAGSYTYPFEFQANNSGSTNRLQIAPYRRAAGSSWQDSAFRLQMAVDSTYTDGTKSYVEIGADDPAVSGGGFLAFGTAGLDRMVVSQTGNVGIGTTTPLSSLHVAGTGNIIRADSTNNSNAGADFLGRKARGTTSAPLAIQAGDRFTGFYGAGYTDLGWSPTNAAAIQMFASENFTSTAQGTYLTFETTPTGTTSRAIAMTILGSGKVGIGTTAPSTALQVNGTVTATGFNGPMASTGYAQSSGNFAISGTGTFSTATGAISLNGPSTIAAGQGLTMASGTGQFSQTYTGTASAATITGGSSASGDLLDLITNSTNAANGDKALNVSVSGANSLGVTRYGVYANVAATGTSSTNVAGYFSASGAGANYGVVVPSGNVGIGNVNPSVPLDLTMDLGASTAGYYTESRFYRPGGSNSGVALGYYSNGIADTAGMIRNTGFGDLILATQGTATISDRLHIANGGNIGIGTSTPANPLDVYGNSSFGVLEVVGNGTAAESSIGFRSSNIPKGLNAGEWVLGSNVSGVAANSFGLYNGGTGAAAFSVNTAGNFGIGTSSASSLLVTTDTGAKSTSYTGVVHNVTNTSSTSSINKVGLDIESTGAWTGTSAINTGLVVNATGGTTNYAATFNGGNVGIGTVYPQMALQINTAASNGGLQVIGSGTSGSVSTAIFANLGAGAWNNLTQAGDMGLIFQGPSIGTTKGFVIGPWINASAGLRIDNAGNVGIGVSSPTSALQVNGTVTATGFSGPMTASTGYAQSSGNFAISGTGTFATATGAVSLNGPTTIAAGQPLTMASGTGQFAQTYTGTGPAHIITASSGASGDLLDLITTSTSAVNGDKALNISVSGGNGSAATRYGVFSNVTASGASSTNVAGYFSAAGATSNYGLLVPNGLVGIGTTLPTSLFHSVDTAAKTANYTGVVHAVSSTSNTNSINKIGLDVESTGTWNGTGATNTGLYVNASGGTTNYAAILTGGNVGIGSATPQTTLDLNNGTLSAGTDGSFMSFNTFYSGGWFFKNNGNASFLRQDTTGLQFWTSPTSNSSGSGAAMTPGTRMTIAPAGNVGIGTATPNSRLEVTSANAGSSGLRLTNLTSSSATSGSFSSFLGVNSTGDVGLVPFNVATTGSALAYWDGTADPTVTGQAYPLGTLTGNAVFNGANGVRLTAASGGQNGALNWQFGQVPFERIQFRVYAGGGSGADATWFYAFTDAVPGTEYGSGITKGYVVALSEYHSVASLGWGSGSDWTGSQYGNTLQQTTVNNIGNSTWHDVDIIVRYNQVSMRLDGVNVINYTDTYNRDLSGLNFGFGARTGGSTNNHYIKGLVVTKLGSNPADFAISPVTSIQSGLYWDSVNGRMGIGTAKPANALDVNGGVAVGGFAGTTAPTNGLIVSGNLGIGSAAPTSLLQTTDTAAKSASYTGVLFNAANTSSTASVNKVGLDIESTGAWSGTSALNTGLVVNVSGGATNYAAVFTGGNVGVGTSQPAYALDVAGSVRGSGNILAASHLGADGSAASPSLGFSSDTTTGLFRAAGPTLGFTIGGSEKMRLTSSGSVGVGTQSPAYKLDVAGDVNASGCVRASGSNIGGTCSSDERLKTDVRTFDIGLDALLGIQPRYYKYNGLGGTVPSEKPELGVIAQEVERTAPGLIVTKDVKLDARDTRSTEIKQVNYTAFTYVLINAVKELYHQWLGDSQTLHREIASLKVLAAQKDQRIDELERKLRQKQTEVEDRLRALERKLNGH